MQSRAARTLRLARVSMIAALSIFAIVAAACSDDNGAGSVPPSTAGSPTTLTVELDWVPNPDHVGLYTAQDAGGYADANLAVDFRSPSNAADPIKLVALGKVDVAVTYEPEMFYAQQNDLPVIAIAAVIPVPLNAMIVSPDVPVTSLDQMAGRSVGVTGVPSDDAFYSSFLKTAGLGASDVTKVSVGYNLLPSLLSNKVDAIIGGYQNVEAIQVQQETGETPTVFPATELGVPTYAELVIAANAERLASDAAYADAVRRFVAATIAGTDGAIADPEGSIALMKRVTQYDPAFLEESVPYTLKLMTPAAGTKTGCLDIDAWRSYGDWMLSNGLIERPPDASALATTDYMPYPCT